VANLKLIKRNKNKIARGRYSYKKNNETEGNEDRNKKDGTEGR
jgi:hypothetical protein